MNTLWRFCKNPKYNDPYIKKSYVFYSLNFSSVYYLLSILDHITIVSNIKTFLKHSKYLFLLPLSFLIFTIK